CCFSFEVS
ncbi:DNA gyrase/topoisomerase IV, subunit A family protein, partial [Chlamydia psittaci 84-8471/1]